MAEFVMPTLGADMTAGTLLSWMKKPGDEVKRGEIIAEVDTDKGVIEVEVFTGGVIDKLLIEPGAEVPVGTVLAIIREEHEVRREELPTGHCHSFYPRRSSKTCRDISSNASPASSTRFTGREETSSRVAC